MSFCDNFKKLRKQASLSQAALAQRLGLSQQAVAKWESGRATPDPDTLILLAEAFGVSVDALVASGPCASRLPVLGFVRAGFGAPAAAEREGEEYAFVGNAEEYFFLTVRGESMEPYIFDGDIALVHATERIANGDLCVAMYSDSMSGGDDCATVKRYRRRADGAVALEPLNPAFEPIIIEKEALASLKLVGKVVETRRKWS